MVEVVWNEGQHFSTVREKLDKFSTLPGFGEIGGQAGAWQSCVSELRPGISHRRTSHISQLAAMTEATKRTQQ